MTVTQLKNHYHTCREKWKAWVAMNNMPGIEFTDEGLPTAVELKTEKFLAFFEMYGPYGRYVARNKVSRQLLSDGTHVSVLEQVGMTLFILAKGASYRDVADTFQHSPTTVGTYFHLNCIGALDGTHIEAVLGENYDQYQGRKGVKTWNVLACCSFDEIFTFVNAGWEGSVHDTTILKDSITQTHHCFPHPPPGKYYLVDSGYPNTLGYLAPYKDKSARYHMLDFRNQPPTSGIYENFNYRHSSLRTTIERAFGILKSTWKVLRVMSQVDGKCQTHIILATFTLHNFIRMHN